MQLTPLTYRIADRDTLLMIEVLAAKWKCKPTNVITKLVAWAFDNHTIIKHAK